MTALHIRFDFWIYVCMLAGGLGWPATSYSASTTDIGVFHCTTDCGKVLLGAAKLTPEGVVWKGYQIPTSLTLSSNSGEFGFSGLSTYVGEAPISGVWINEGALFLAISNPLPVSPKDGAPRAPFMGHYFAPRRSGTVQAVNHYQALFSDVPAVSKDITTQGEGILDGDGLQPGALTLEVNSSAQGTPCASQPACEKISTTSNVIFTVTPHYDANRKPAEAEEVRHVLVELGVIENGTDTCRAFDERDFSPNNFDVNNYLHYLESSGPNTRVTGCIRRYFFLVSVDKSFHFMARPWSEHTENSAFVDYLFFVRGHYDSNNLNKWPGSHKTYRLTNTSAVLYPPTASLLLTPTSGAAPLEVTLDAGDSSSNRTLNYLWEIKRKTDAKTVEPYLPDVAEPQLVKATFNEAGVYDVSLTVEDNARLMDRVTNMLIVTPPPVAIFTITPSSGHAPLNVMLDASLSKPGDGNLLDRYEWRSNGQPIALGEKSSYTFEQAGTYEISLVVRNDLGQRSLPVFQTLIVNSPTDFQARLSGPDSAVLNTPVTLDASASAVPMNTRVDYHWSVLLEGAPAQEGINYTLEPNDSSLVQAVFKTPGQYQVSVELRIATGSSSTDSYTLSVTNSLEYPKDLGPVQGVTLSMPLDFTKTIMSTSSLKAGIQLVENKEFVDQLLTSQAADIAARFELSPEHQGKQAAIVLIVGFTALTTESTSWFYKQSISTLLDWIPWPPLDFSVAFPAAQLESIQEVPIYHGQLPAGNYKIFVGYLIKDQASSANLLFFNAENPLSFEVN